MLVKLFNLSRLIAAIAVMALLTVIVPAETEGLQREREIINQASDQMWYAMGFLAFLILSLAAWLWWRSKVGVNRVEYNYKNRYENYHSRQAAEKDPVDAQREAEWANKAKDEPAKKKDTKISYKEKKAAKAEDDASL